MSTSNREKVPVAGLDQARETFRDALEKGPLEDNRERLAELIFGENGETAFWSVISTYQSVEPLSLIELAKGFYTKERMPGEERRSSSRELQRSLDKLVTGINDFCEEGVVRDLIHGEIDRLYVEELKQRLGLKELIFPAGETALTLLRKVIKEHRDELIRAVMTPRSRPLCLDLSVAYLIAVFKAVFPDKGLSRGEESLSFKFIKLTLESCMPICQNTVESRIRNISENVPFFEYDNSSGKIIPTAQLTEIMQGLGAGKLNGLTKSRLVE
jgi:hypothetical protein